MGKGYNNYMCKKPFHPGSKANIKRSWMAEQKTENEKKKQEELKAQYDKEQDLYNNRALLSTESKDKLELNFMYEAPPGAKRERQKEDDEPEYKFEWQRKYNAPREDYAKGNADIKDQPFGIPVRNVRCIKCHKWGHINTDKECPLFSQASTSSMPTTSMDPMELMRQMKEDGYGLKENVLGHHLNPKAANQQLLSSEESDPEMEFLKSLSTAEKKKLLRKLKKLSKKQEKSMNCKKKKNRKSKKSKNQNSDSDCGGKKKCKKSKKTSNDSSSDESEPKATRKKKCKRSESEKNLKNLKRRSSSESSSTDSESEEERHTKKLKQDLKSTYEDQHSSSVKERAEGFKTEKHEIEKSSQNKTNSDFKSSKQLPKKDLRNGSKIKNISDFEHFESHSKSSKYEMLKYSKDSESTKCYNSDEDEINDEELKNYHNQRVDKSPSAEMFKTKHDFSDSETITQKQTKDKIAELVHPDGFSHLYPQAIIKSNYVQTVKEYEGGVDDKFRFHNRERRSPSVKQKYNK